jgi:hypothetical protein
MLNLICKIEIIGKDNKKISFDYCNQIEIKTSCKNLTDTAIVRVPRKMNWKEKPLTDFIAQGNKITIALGYKEYGLKPLFQGYIKSIENSVPVAINCENDMWNFKKITVPAEKIAKFNLKNYIEKYGAGVKVDISENLSFGALDIVEEMSLAQALDKIMQTYPYLLGYFQDGIFKAVLSTKRWAIAPKPTVFDPSRNIVSNSLKYTVAEDIKICIKAVSIQRNNTQGMFAGSVSDNFDERIEQKIFHAEIVVDNAKVAAETKACKKIPVIADFTYDAGNDVMQQVIENNYNQIKTDVKQIVAEELKRIEEDPELQHLIKKE